MATTEDKENDIFEEIRGRVVETSTTEKAKKKRTPRPKVTVDLLYKQNGFPKLHEMFKGFKNSGLGKEADDLRKVISMYETWSKQVMPGMDFDLFIDQTEKVCGTHTARDKFTGLKNGEDPQLMGVDATLTQGTSDFPITDPLT
jgi:hypothetical protein